MSIDMALNDCTARRENTALWVVALGVFAVTSTEMMPIGLLPDIAADLGASEGHVGLSVTLYGVLAGLLAPVLTSAFRRLDRRALLLLILATFTVGNAATALAVNYPMLMASRLIIGLIHGVLWSIVASIAVRLVRPDRAVQATAIVFSGISLALVLGVPVGALIGHFLGWRSAFWILAALTALTFTLLAALLPSLPPTGSPAARELPRLLRIRNLRVAVALTSVVVIGNYAAYTYITPFLRDHARIDADWVSGLLLCYGIAGVVGNFVGARFADGGRPPRKVLVTFVAVLCGSLILLVPAGAWTLGVTTLLIVWGAAYSALPVILQTLVFRSVPDSREAATSIYVLAFNVSIALGALAGGVAIDAAGPVLPIMVGAVFCASSMAAALLLRDPSTPADGPQHRP